MTIAEYAAWFKAGEKLEAVAAKFIDANVDKMAKAAAYADKFGGGETFGLGDELQKLLVACSGSAITASVDALL